MREELVELEEPGVWNAFVRELKRKILKGELGGERREVWWQVRRNGLGLVDRKLSALSEVGEEEAREVRSFLYLLCFFNSFVALRVGSQGQEPCRLPYRNYLRHVICSFVSGSSPALPPS